MEKDRIDVKRVPNLRFPEFEGVWEKAVLDDLGDFTGGGTPTSSNIDYWKGTIPWISSSDLEEENISKINISRYITKDAILNSATKLCYAPVIAIVTRVGVGKIAYSKENICTSQDFTNITNLKCDGLFLSYLLSKILKKKAGEAQGTSIKGITSKEIKLIKLHIPSLTEQQKIASLLSLIDERITTQSKIIEGLKELKASLSKQLFSRKFRFKDENGMDFPEWEEKSLGEVGDVKMCKRIFNEQTTPEGDIPFYKIGSFGRKADAYISKDLYLEYKNKFSFPQKGEILISAAGTIGRTIVYNGEDAYYQDSNIVWIQNDNTVVSNEFLYYILQIVKYNTEGGTIQRLYNNILRTTKFNCPSLAEQRKIANFLSNIDSKIEVETKTFELQKRQKQYLLQQMFI